MGLEDSGKYRRDVVLTSSWRELWDPDPALRAPDWASVGDSLDRFGVEIYDRTPAYGGNDRDREVQDWLTAPFYEPQDRAGTYGEAHGEGGDPFEDVDRSVIDSMKKPTGREPTLPVGF